jgi:hypothetical protein
MSMLLLDVTLAAHRHDLHLRGRLVRIGSMTTNSHLDVYLGRWRTAVQLEVSVTSLG